MSVSDLTPGPSTTGGLSDSLFRSHFEDLPDPAFIWRRLDGDFELVAFNRAGDRVSFSAVRRLVGVRSSALYADQPEVEADLHRCSDRNETFTREFDYRFTSDTVRRVRVTYVPLGRDIVVAHVQDLTEQRANELALLRSAERMKALIEANLDVIFRIDGEARVLDLHVPDRMDFPWDPDTLIGATIEDFCGADVQRRHLRVSRDAIATGRAKVFEYHVEIGDRRLHLESRVVPAGGDQVIVTVRDISERVALEARMTVQAERERNRLGREIHDGLAQNLAGARMLLEHLERRVRETDEEFAADCARAAELVNLTVEQARQIVRGLSPIKKGASIFDALGLLATHAERYLGLSCRTRLDGNATRVDELATVHLYRIAQEAVTNAMRHGGASSVEIRCTIAGEELTLSIGDDGRGFRARSDKPAGFGLRIMRHRARALGGQIQVTPREGGGTLVTCCCPLPESDPAG